MIGWAGLRGVVTLAAAFLIPEDVPEREVLILAAMVVTAGHPAAAGADPAGVGPGAEAARTGCPVRRPAGRDGAADRRPTPGSRPSNRLVQPTDAPETVELLGERIRARPEAMWEALGRTDSETPSELYRRLRLQTLQVERDEVLKIRSSGTIDHDVLEQVLASFDIEESMLTIATRRADQLTEEQPVQTPPSPAGSCIHLDQAPAEIEPAGPRICQDCVREGTRTVHLRICLTCGNVGCCNSSVGRHAERHGRTTHHPVMRSFEPGESWRWCYVDERLADAVPEGRSVDETYQDWAARPLSGTHDVGGAA